MNYKWILISIFGVVFGLCQQGAAYTSPIENGTTEVVQTSWNLSTNIYVGNLTGGNSLIITNGGDLVTAGFSYIGYKAASDNNNVVLTGAGSTWTCNGLQLGRQGSNNRLSVLDGAKFYGSSGYYSALGSSYASTGNEMLVDGIGSEWTTRLILMVDGPHNTITVSGGAKINGGTALVLGARSSADYNTVTIDGAGTIVDITTEICMGVDWWDWQPGEEGIPKGIGSKLSIQSGALCTVGETIKNWNYSTVEVGKESLLSAQSYSMNSNSDLIFECSENPTDSGKMNMSGTIVLAGDLIVTLEAGINISSGYSVDLMDGTISGTFSSITLPALPSHLSWDTSLLYSEGIIFTGVLDSDNDGMADPWEVDHFGNVISCNPTADYDADGLNNYSEYIAGTNPKLKSSCLNITLDFVGNDCVIDWEPVQNRVYSLEWTPNILYTPFSTLQGGLVFPQSRAIDTNNPLAHGFYRINVLFNQ